MRPFEMADAERRAWAAIENLVDVEKYRAEQPLILLQIGVVHRARPYPQIVEWEDGTKERVSPERMPGEFAAYKAGQSFEALVHRNPITYKIVRVEYVKRVLKGAVTREETEKLWNSTRTSSDFPDTDWD
ncbi:hypothetical protein J8F10_13855 [Gemmata sp. G18]|uniref:Uncharacterized protein n=1 Tax=Gemmata palustris TaxID=2822762 RepID=A0ABS5BRL3_9BACT|nr:hypothetical protein [Gemmata palustris]MBP3956365.1 hypothetical protein [Gemmata palustris]